MPEGEFLLEVRCEEIPARMLGPGIRELATRLFEELVACKLTPGELETGFTPRRLVVVLKKLPAAEPDREERVLGPPVRAAYDAKGRPTAAATGFAKRCGLEPAELARVETDKGQYVAAVRRVAGRPAAEVLAELVPALLSELRWPKTMRWGSGRGPWVRPVHGVVALLDGKVVPFELYGVTTADTTRGHPLLSPRPFKVRGAADYRRKLKRRGIEVRYRVRRDRLRKRLEEAAKELGGELVEDPALLRRLASVCAIPGVVVGRFDAAHLSLPREVLTTSLRDHQSAFTVAAGERLLPCFLTVMDRPDDPAGRVRAGNEWVVEARLADARFFWQEDRKRSLAERRPALERLTFHARLGSYADKSRRIAQLAEVLCEGLGWTEELEAVNGAAALLKVDLTTEMVKEFTSLQGIMGGVYARAEEYPEAVWQAIYDQYLPVSTEGPIPRGRAGQVLALADRLDTLVGIFGLGLKPTGSKDPFGLRRAAQGVVRIVLEAGLPIDLDLVAARGVLLYGERLELGGEEVLAELRPFLHDRVRHLLGRQGFAYDSIEAALAVAGSDLPDLRARVTALEKARREPGFLSVVLAAKRIANILKDAPERQLDPELLKEPAEQALHEAAAALRSEVKRAEEAGQYERSLEAIGELAPVLDRFFVEVLVMDENRDLRFNRIALLQSIQRLVSRTARLTEVVVDRTEHRQRAEQQD